MFTPITKRDAAKRYHRFLPDEMRQYLNGRGISDGIIDRHLLGWNGRRITIPVFDRDGEVLAYRFAKSPNDPTDGPKMLSEVGSVVELYGWDTLARHPHTVVICEGEFDRLVLESRGIPAVTSTGGAGIFRAEWVPYFSGISRVFICFDRDEAGQAGAANVKRLLRAAAIVKLPADVGENGDITDYFVRLGKSRVDFDLLLASAASEDPTEATDVHGEPPKFRVDRPRHKAVARRAERLKRAIPIDRVVSLYTALRPSGAKLVGRCPFHEETTASFTVYPDTGTYYCFGCRAHGDLVAFLRNKESMTYGQALEALESFLYTDELFPTS